MIRSLDQVTEFPLCWPQNKPRAAKRQGSTRFSTTLAKAHRELTEEMGMWKGARYVLSMAPSYRQGPTDPGVALWWSMPAAVGQQRELRVLACDTWPWPDDNLHAIVLTLRGMRAFERYGTYTKEQAAEGARLSLPPPESEALDWPVILGVKRDWPLDAIEAMWKNKVAQNHPDRGGDPKKTAELNAAMDAARKELHA